MKRSNPIEDAFKANLARITELEAEVARLEWQVEEWRKANLPIVSKCAELQRQLAQVQVQAQAQAQNGRESQNP